MANSSPAQQTNMGQPTPRFDARLKVTGAARYPSDEPLANPAFACLATSSIARGAIREMNLESARAVSGVLDILTFRNANQVRPLKTFGGGGQSASSIVPLSSAKIWHDGQIVALVVAELSKPARKRRTGSSFNMTRSGRARPSTRRERR